MDRNDREAIETLFDKIAEVERSSPPRDGQSEALIRDRIGSHPAAPYYMAQTIVVQEQALEAAERRIAELEAETSGAGGGLFGSLFGGNRNADQARGSVPGAGKPAPSEPHGSPGFLAGAAQTALGVTGGVLLGNAIAGMLGSGKAEAAEASNAKDDNAREDEPAREDEDASQNDDDDDGGDFEEASFDGGGDFGDF